MEKKDLLQLVAGEGAQPRQFRAAVEALLRAAAISLGADGSLLSFVADGRETVLVSHGLALPDPLPTPSAGLRAAAAAGVLLENVPDNHIRTAQGEVCRLYAATSFPIDGPIKGSEIRGVLAVCAVSTARAISPEEMREMLDAFGEAAAGQLRCLMAAQRHDDTHDEVLAARIETAMESTTDSVIILDPAWTITYVNRRAHKIFPEGVDPIGRKLLEAFPEAGGSSFDEAYQRAFRLQEPQMVVDFYAPLNAWFEVHAYPSPKALTLFFRDITREKTLEEQLQQAQRIEAVGQLAGGIAHDFNNLLTVINGYTQLLLGRAGVGDPNRKELENIRDAGDRAAQLTQQLLAFGRKQVLQPKRLTLNEIVSAVKPLLSRVLPESIELTTHLATSPDPVKADPAQIEQVLMNLVINARDAMAAGGRLTIETANVELDEQDTLMLLDAAPGRYAMLAVSDTGTGMTPEVRGRIFEPFFTTKPKGQGTGLGLPTVFGIVKQSGGHIAVESAPGRGSTFNIYLPVTAETTAAAAVEAAPETSITPSKRTVLLVEDDEYVRDFTSAVLKQFGYVVLQAANGPEALRLSAEYGHPIDLLLTDVIMPKMSGRELAGEITKRRPETRVLFVSGYTEDSLSPGGELDPGLAFLQKPYTPRDLAARVRSVIETSNRGRAILVVDDEEAVCDLLRTILETANYTVEVAHDGREAIRLVREQPFDLVLTDLVMPGQEGIVTIQLLKQEFPHLKIIAMSGAVSLSILAAAKHLGADEVLQKPIAASRLLQLVKEMTG